MFRRVAISVRRLLAAAGMAAVLAACSTAGTANSGSSTSTTRATSVVSAPNILAVSTRLVRTRAGTVAFREVGRGKPLLLITGFSASMDYWPPSFIDALASHHQVIIIDNAGVGETTPVAPSITAMADQTSDLISALGLKTPAVLGWSMGGLIAQALAVEHPARVSALILAATQPGTGKALPVPSAAASALASPNPAAALAFLFPPNQGSALRSYVKGIFEYGNLYAASAATKASQNLAIAQWFAGRDLPGRQVGNLRVPTLVADGTMDDLDPASNDRLLASLIPHAKLVLYPDAGHAFLFQDASTFIPTVDDFLG
jgi:pimeloyl-ACP methyl ester carboxylesterase